MDSDAEIASSGSTTGSLVIFGPDDDGQDAQFDKDDQELEQLVAEHSISHSGQHTTTSIQDGVGLVHCIFLCDIPMIRLI